MKRSSKIPRRGFLAHQQSFLTSNSTPHVCVLQAYDRVGYNTLCLYLDFEQDTASENLGLSHTDFQVAAANDTYSAFAVNAAVNVRYSDFEQMHPPEFMNMYSLVGLRLIGHPL